MIELFNKPIELYNLNEIIKKYDFTCDHLMLGIDTSGSWADLIVYDTSDMLETPQDIEDFYSIVNENALDIEDFEIDRIALFN